MIDQEKRSGNAFDFPVMRRIFTFVGPYKGIFYLTVLLTLLLAALGPVRPWLTQLALDDHIIHANYQGLMQITIAMIFVLMVQSVIQFLQAYMSGKLGQLVIRDMRIQLFNRMLSFPIIWFDHTPVGTSVTRAVSDMETVADVFSDGIIIIVGDIVQLTVIIGYMFYIDWQLTLWSLSTIPLLMIATNVFKNKIKSSFNDVRTQVAALNNFVQEHITGMKIVQMFNREQREMKNFDEINLAHRDANIRSVWYYSIFFPVVEILSAISIGLLIWWGAGDVIEGKTTFGTLVAFIMYINLLFRPIRELADKFNTLQMGVVSSERIFKVFDTPLQTVPHGDIMVKSRPKGAVEFRDVWFAYKDEDWVLKGVSFGLRSDETIALVGSTGSGKTSVINLINRFYEHNKGDILIDGISLRDYDSTSLRKHIAVVLQDVFLFSDTIYNNIVLGDTSITREKVTKAAEMIGAMDFINKLPGAFDYHVGERGNLLSMGQRQLISFIRAYVTDPAILILDEATSSIDTESEELITRATEILTKGRSSIVIAHRLATVLNADKIIVLDHGKILESGPHQVLIKNGGHYMNLFKTQFESH
jgi:ATP-binding cassette subfamily B protein